MDRRPIACVAEEGGEVSIELIVLYVLIGILCRITWKSGYSSGTYDESVKSMEREKDFANKVKHAIGRPSELEDVDRSK